MTSIAGLVRAIATIRSCNAMASIGSSVVRDQSCCPSTACRRSGSRSTSPTKQKEGGTGNALLERGYNAFPSELAPAVGNMFLLIVQSAENTSMST